MHLKALLNLMIWIAVIYAGVYGLNRFYGMNGFGEREVASEKQPSTATVPSIPLPDRR